VDHVEEVWWEGSGGVGTLGRPGGAEHHADGQLVVVLQGEQGKVFGLEPAQETFLCELHSDGVQVNVLVLGGPEHREIRLLER